MVNGGGSFCTTSNPCPACTGDCDNDSQCQIGLTCVQRNAGEAPPLACIAGGSGDVDGHDYWCTTTTTSAAHAWSIVEWLRCLLPVVGLGLVGDSWQMVLLVSVFSAETAGTAPVGQAGTGAVLVHGGGSFCTAAAPCPVCTGDCDADVDCQTGLTCIQREAGGAAPPGCVAGGAGDVDGHDYCAGQPMVNGGSSFCTAAAPCPACTGDCDNDSDCQAGLSCNQRGAGEAPPLACIPGGAGDVSGHDYVSGAPSSSRLLPGRAACWLSERRLAWWRLCVLWPFGFGLASLADEAVSIAVRRDSSSVAGRDGCGAGPRRQLFLHGRGAVRCVHGRL